MDLIQAAILGIVQGVTEFFPVSSSAHLSIVKQILSLPRGEELLYFDLLCHLGTLFALLIYLRKEVFEVLSSLRQIALFSLALLPLVPAYFLLKKVRLFFSDPAYLGFFLMGSGIFLWVASRKKKSSSTPQKWSNMVWIGCAQAIALIPGISRSGSTIGTARLLGCNWVDGAKCSFLLAIPTILGGELLETIKKLQGEKLPLRMQIPWESYLVGALFAFLVGLVAVRAIFWIYKKEKILPVALYCIGIGLVTWIFSHG